MLGGVWALQKGMLVDADVVVVPLIVDEASTDLVAAAAAAVSAAAVSAATVTFDSVDSFRPW